MKPIELRLISNKNGLIYKDDILRTPELANNFSWMDMILSWMVFLVFKSKIAP